MLRVLHCIYDDPLNPWVGGGGAVRVLDLYRRLRSRLAEVTIASGAFPGAFEGVADGIRHVRLGTPRQYLLSRISYSIEASRLLARGDYDVAVYDFSTYTPLRLPADRPVGVTVHHITGQSASERWGGLTGRIVAAQERARLRRARVFSATSRVTYDELRRVVGPEPAILSVAAGVPDELFELDRRDDDYLLYFGRLDWFQKGLDVLLQSMKLLVATHPNIRLKVAGRGKDAERVRDEIHRLGIAANVEMVGPVDDEARNALFSGARLLLMPSRFEGFGMVAAEGMAAGIPIVATAAGSLPEVIDPPAGGVLVPPGDPRALADAVEMLLRDPWRRQTLGQTARFSAERFRWDRVANAHLGFIQHIYAAYANPQNSENV